MELTGELKDAINAQVTHEIAASVVYRQLSLDMEALDLPLVTWCVEAQAEEEASVGAIISRVKLIGNDGIGLLRLDEELGARGTTTD